MSGGVSATQLHTTAASDPCKILQAMLSRPTAGGIRAAGFAVDQSTTSQNWSQRSIVSLVGLLVPLQDLKQFPFKH